MGMAGGNARVATGTFSNNGTASVSLNIGFEPDVVYISCGYGSTEYATAGWIGCAFLCIVKNETMLYYRHNNDTSTMLSVGVNTNLGGNHGAYGGIDAPTQNFYGTYSDGVLTVENRSPNTAYTHFIPSEVYTWVAFAKT